MSRNSKLTIASRITGVLFGALATVVVVNEGMKTSAYQDGAGVWTICAGETNGVKKGDTATPSECQAMLARSLVEHAGALEGLPNTTPDVTVLAGVDMAYNVGVTAFRNSAVKRHLMHGDYNAASKAVLDWKYISKSTSSSPGVGWVRTAPGKWRYDCSQYINGKPNKVCYGLWKRRLWQSKGIGNQFKSTDIAISELKKL